MPRLFFLCVFILIEALPACKAAFADWRSLSARLHHLRIDGPREWSSFPKKSEGPSLKLNFIAKKNSAENTLRLRHQDVKQTWEIVLNGKPLGRLRRNENDMVVYLPVPPGTLKDGTNTLLIEQNARSRKTPDDIRVGEIALNDRLVQAVLCEATVEIEVLDTDTRKHTPCRLTIVNAAGALQATGAKSNLHLAVRPGIIYTATGKARFGLPAGKYTIYAGRGFEYSLASVNIALSAGARVRRKLTIRREVPTAGYVACDTHVHTLTHSGHGDCTVQERMVTLAGEGIELPIATDHNVHIDHKPFAAEQNVRRYFTPVIGNEVTTRLGHFNIFPVKPGAKIPNYKLKDWKSIFADIYRTPDVKICILNHARDIHAGTRPFGPKLHQAVVGENLNGWKLRANAMEVINSAAIQSDGMLLFRDWMSLLNRGRILTPVGSSDSHDVARHFVGQGRTYIRCDDGDPGNIPVEQAVNSFLQGRVMVSYGLAVELTVDGRYGPGELAPATNDKVRVFARVLGPQWVKADEIVLFANGKGIREVDIRTADGAKRPRGVKWQGEWLLPRPGHDVHLVAVALGPGIDGPYWKTAKPYQPTSPQWIPRVIGSSGAVWLDVDSDGRRTPAYDYAARVFAKSGSDLKQLLKDLARYDEAAAAHAAHLYQKTGASLFAADVRAKLQQAAPHVRAGFRAYREAWRKNHIARGE